MFGLQGIVTFRRLCIRHEMQLTYVVAAFAHAPSSTGEDSSPCKTHRSPMALH